MKTSPGPGVIKKEMAKTINSMEEEMQTDAKMPYFTKLPPKGLGRKGVEQLVSNQLR